MHKTRRARAVAIARTEDATKIVRLRLLALSFGAIAALMALPVLF